MRVPASRRVTNRSSKAHPVTKTASGVYDNSAETKDGVMTSMFKSVIAIVAILALGVGAWSV
jgi:hypothetical protein